ncbi:hypothetical protein EVAR_27679_1 [Eumeta japonica]|uniref:DNA helicase Pif1-like 2B domain-containing protein n=1 Tax=Eumeta variegata TaxID=151549 RepID=A0A4C2A4H3_EUMVA|nr:hypothetical protein EVAR_27679_1 [Eumeta japonica]
MIANDKNKESLSERAILAAKNKDVDDLSFAIQNVIVGTLHSFKSVDCVTNEDEATNYPTEFLNFLDVLGLALHNLQLKVGSVVIILRNLNQPKLCNGTRLVITKLMTKVIEAMILKGKFKVTFARLRSAMQKCQDLRNLDTCDNFRSFAVIDRGCDDVEPAALDPTTCSSTNHPRTSHNRLSTELVHAARARARRATPTTRRSETFTPVGLRCTNSKSLQAPVHRTSKFEVAVNKLTVFPLQVDVRARALIKLCFPFFMEDNYLFVSSKFPPVSLDTHLNWNFTPSQAIVDDRPRDASDSRRQVDARQQSSAYSASLSGVRSRTYTKVTEFESITGRRDTTTASQLQLAERLWLFLNLML